MSKATRATRDANWVAWFKREMETLDALKERIDLISDRLDNLGGVEALSRNDPPDASIADGSPAPLGGVPHAVGRGAGEPPFLDHVPVGSMVVRCDGCGRLTIVSAYGPEGMLRYCPKCATFWGQKS